MIGNWHGVAFNQDPHSANEIHGDDLAQRFGFEGGLVPGVTISAYLMHPAVQAWGADFLARGNAHVRVHSPLYDGETFTVEITGQDETSYSADLLRANGVLSASAEVALPAVAPAPPERRHDALAPPDYAPPTASPEAFVAMMTQGCHAFCYRWESDNPMRSYLRNVKAMPALLVGEAPQANMSFILGVSNWVAADNVAMNPWVHLETRSQNFHPVADDTTVVAEMQVTDIFARKGHRFFDARVNLFDAADNQCLSSIELRAIYQLRGT